MMTFAKESPLSLVEAARLLGVHRKTIENWFANGLEHRKMGRLLYTSREALDRFSIPSVLSDPQPRHRNVSSQAAADVERELAERYGI